MPASLARRAVLTMTFVLFFAVTDTAAAQESRQDTAPGAAQDTTQGTTQVMPPATPRAEPRVSLLFPTGALIPTGGQRHVVKGAELLAVQLIWALRPTLALTGSVGLAHSRNLAAVDAPRVDIFTGDLGLERQLFARCQTCRVSVSGFAGVGAGARRYDQRGPGFEASTAFMGYGSVGGELGMGRVRLRVEARDYVGGATALPGTRAGVGNDVVILAGLRLVRRR